MENGGQHKGVIERFGWMTEYRMGNNTTPSVHFNRQSCLMFQGQRVRALGELTQLFYLCM